MSTVRTTITVEVSGALGRDERPVMQRWEFTHNAWDNPERYRLELAQAVRDASAKVVNALNNP